MYVVCGDVCVSEHQIETLNTNSKNTFHNYYYEHIVEKKRDNYMHIWHLSGYGYASHYLMNVSPVFDCFSVPLENIYKVSRVCKMF